MESMRGARSGEMMDGARLLDGLVTTEFAFIQELIWSPPHKNPFPTCSNSILSRLKNLSAEWRRASPTTRQSAMSLIENLDADIKVLIELRKRCFKMLTCKASTADEEAETSQQDKFKLTDVCDYVSGDELPTKVLSMKMSGMNEKKKAKLMEEVSKRAVQRVLEDEMLHVADAADARGKNSRKAAKPVKWAVRLRSLSPGGLATSPHGGTYRSDAAASDASTYNAYLAEKVDSILVQHLENSWNGRSFKLTDTEIQKQKSIDQDCLAADVLPLFVSEADPQANRARELSVVKHCSPYQGQSLLASVEHSAANCEQEPGFHNLTTDTTHGAGRQSAVGATSKSVKEMIYTSNVDGNSSKGSGTVEEPCVSTTKPDATPTSSECDAPKATLCTSIQAQSALASNEGPHLTTKTPEAVTDTDSSECSRTDEDSTTTSEAKPNLSSKGTEHLEDYLEQAVAGLPDSSFSSTADEYFSASSDGEHDSMVGTRVTESRDDFQRPESAIGVNGAASLMGANGSDISEVQHFPPAAGPVYGKEIQIFSSNKVTDEAPKIDEHNQRESRLDETPGMKDEVKSKYAKNCSKAEELVQVEMTLRAKICEPEGDEPYWNVMFALLNHSNFKVSVQKLEYWSLDKQEDVQCIHWGPGEMILREQPSFLCHNIKVLCSASNTSPRLAFSWQYSKLPEWIPTKDGKPKLEKETIRKRFRNMVCFQSAEKKLKHDRDYSSLKSTKKRTA